MTDQERNFSVHADAPVVRAAEQPDGVALPAIANAVARLAAGGLPDGAVLSAVMQAVTAAEREGVPVSELLAAGCTPGRSDHVLPWLARLVPAAHDLVRAGRAQRYLRGARHAMRNAIGTARNAADMWAESDVGRASNRFRDIAVRGLTTTSGLINRRLDDAAANSLAGVAHAPADRLLPNLVGRLASSGVHLTTEWSAGAGMVPVAGVDLGVLGVALHAGPGARLLALPDDGMLVVRASHGGDTRDEVALGVARSVARVLGGALAERAADVEMRLPLREHGTDEWQDLGRVDEGMHDEPRLL